MSRPQAKWVILSGALILSAIGAFFLIRFVAFVVIWGNMLYDRDFMDASAKNGRGDVVKAETDFFGMPDHRSKSVIWLNRAGHWFSTTLIETRSWEVLIGLQWRNDDTLDLQLDFGCGAQTSVPVTSVGPVRIVYHWGDPGDTPKVGYESFRRRDLPPEKCE